MNLNELKAIMAASLLGGSIGEFSTIPRAKDIEIAIQIAQKIWEEVLKQEREER